MIEPTVGRVVWFYPLAGGGPLAAIVCKAHSATCVNLTVSREDGLTIGLEHVHLKQDVEEYPRPYCEWMSYQKDQAAKTEQLEAVQKAAEKGFWS